MDTDLAAGLEKKFGRCERSWEGQQGRGADFDPFKTCDENINCQIVDINLVCNTNVTVQQGGKCECRTDMRWNTGSVLPSSLLQDSSQFLSPNYSF